MDFSSWSREGLHMSLLRLRCSLSSCIPTSAAFPPNKAATDRILLVFAKMQLVEAWWCSGKVLECGGGGCRFDSFLDSLPKSAWGYTGLCIQPFVTRMQWHINEHKLNFEYWIFRCFHQSLSMGSSIHWSMVHHSSKQLTKIAVSYPCLGWGSVTLLQLPLEQKIAQPMTTDFSLYETFLEMENEGHLGKFYIIQPWQNWDNWLNKPVSQFHFGADIDRDIFTK